MDCLDTNEKYIKLSKNGEVGEFLKGKYKDIPVDNVKEFNLFYEALNNKIAELADTDKRAKIFLEQANYQRELNELPHLMNKLERINSNIKDISFKKLKPRFEASLSYVYDAVMNKGIKINGPVEIKKYHNHPEIIFKDSYNMISTDFSLLNEDYSKIKLFSFLGKDPRSCFWRSPNINLKEFIEKYNRAFLHSSNSEKIISQIKTILYLPQIINKELGKKIKKQKENKLNLENCLKELEN